MKDCPVEFMPGFWVSKPEGLIDKRKYFLINQNIKSAFTVNCDISQNQNISVISMTKNEIQNPNYIEAFIRIILETWVETKSIVIISQEDIIENILISFLTKIGRISNENSLKIIKTKI